MARLKAAHPSSNDQLKYYDEENAINDPQVRSFTQLSLARIKFPPHLCLGAKESPI